MIPFHIFTVDCRDNGAKGTTYFYMLMIDVMADFGNSWIRYSGREVYAYKEDDHGLLRT